MLVNTNKDICGREKKKPPNKQMGASLCIMAKELQVILKKTAGMFHGEQKDKAHKPIVNFHVTLQESRTVQLSPSAAMLFIS